MLQSNFSIKIFLALFLLSSCNKESTKLKENANENNKNIKIINKEAGQYRPPKEFKLVGIRSKLMNSIKHKYKLEIKEIVKGTSGGATLYETLWILNLIKDKKVDNNDITKFLKKIKLILQELKDVKNHYKNNDIWGIGFKDIYSTLLSKNVKSNKLPINQKKKLLKTFLNSLKKDLNPNQRKLIDEIHQEYLGIESIKTESPKDPSIISKFKFNLEASGMLVSILERGILTYRPHWWELTDLFIKDKSGVKAYYEAKNEYQRPIAPISFINKTINIVADNNCVKQILLQSAGPSEGLFRVGEVKENLFHPFMPKNVGRSYGKEWRGRRDVNDKVLFYNKLHSYSQIYNDFIRKKINEWKNNGKLPQVGPRFFDRAKTIVTKIVFGDSEKEMPKEIFEMLDDANTLKNILNKNYKIPEKIMGPVKTYFKNNIRNPKPNSLVELAVKNEEKFYCPYIKRKKCQEDEIMNQIPHWIFPLLKDLFATTPRTLMMICSHPYVLNKLKNELESIDIKNAKDIYNAKYLRACVLEILRLNSTVITMLRRLNKNYSFDLAEKYKYKKNDQFLILTNSVNREIEKFKKPNKFRPDRFIKDPDLEKSHYAIMFGQGPQECPGKEIGIFVVASFIAHYLKAFNYNITTTFDDKQVNTNYIEQMYNPGKIKFMHKNP
ncbi:MAG: cytochrome P450 [Bacteroidetes bacterium]|nr:cytochrome P450 [Bacteroidota bacterium]